MQHCTWLKLEAHSFLTSLGNSSFVSAAHIFINAQFMARTSSTLMCLQNLETSASFQLPSYKEKPRQFKNAPQLFSSTSGVRIAAPKSMGRITVLLATVLSLLEAYRGQKNVKLTKKKHHDVFWGPKCFSLKSRLHLTF